MGVCAGARVQSDCELWLLNVNVLLNALQIIQKTLGRRLRRAGERRRFTAPWQRARLHKTYYV